MVKIGEVGKVRQELAREIVPLKDSAKAINLICCYVLCCLISGVEIQAWQHNLGQDCQPVWRNYAYYIHANDMADGLVGGVGALAVHTTGRVAQTGSRVPM